MDFRKRVRHANISLAVTIPTLLIGTFLLRNASEAVFQAFGLTVFFLGFAFIFVLDLRYERRHRRDQ